MPFCSKKQLSIKKAKKKKKEISPGAQGIVVHSLGQERDCRCLSHAMPSRSCLTYARKAFPGQRCSHVKGFSFDSKPQHESRPPGDSVKCPSFEKIHRCLKIPHRALMGEGVYLDLK